MTMIIYPAVCILYLDLKDLGNTTMSQREYFDIDPPRARLLGDLWEYQQKNRHISSQTIKDLAEKYNISQVEVEGVTSFYHFFHRTNAGKHTIYINESILSKLKGYDRIVQAFEKETGAKLHSVDPSGTFGLFPTACIGLSDQEPAALIDFHPFTHLNVIKVKEIVHQLKNGKAAHEICQEVDENIRFTPPKGSLFFAPYNPGEAVQKLTQVSPTQVLEKIQTAGLSGRGGAFFPTAKKWEACRNASGNPKFIICNADEGEPGTFKDRVLLQHAPGSVIEGMIIAAFTTNASYGIIYLRGEYLYLAKKIQQVLDTFRAEGILGQSIAGIKGFDFDIRIEIGAGAYVCGEETALLESMEGFRGEPRTKWFYPVEKGYLQLPTVVNNVETFAAASRIFSLGLSTYLDHGWENNYGTKLISVSGDCKLPGIYELDYGTTVDQLLKQCEADKPWFIQVSGPSGESIHVSEKNRRFSREILKSDHEIRCGGSFMIFNEERDLLRILLNFNAFFKKESCGVCTPCRAGNFILQRKLERLKNGLADANDLQELQDWSTIMIKSSRCGLGKTAPNAILMCLEKFSDYFADKYAIDDDRLIRKFDEETAIVEYEHYKP